MAMGENMFFLYAGGIEMTEHTPGPWENDNGVVAGKDIKDLTRPSFDIFDVSHWHGNKEEAQANAHLIAAAPDLLSACEAIAHGMKETQGFAPNFLEQAIAKAKDIK